MRTRSAAAAAVLTVAATTGLPLAAASAGPPADGCPLGYSLLVVADLTAQGYRVPAQLDDPASGLLSFGSPGNDDGLVCAQEIGSRTTTWGGQLYQFWDDTLPA